MQPGKSFRYALLCMLLCSTHSLALAAGNLAEQLGGVWQRTEFRERPGDPEKSWPFEMTIKPESDGRYGTIYFNVEGKQYTCGYDVTESNDASGAEHQILLSGQVPFSGKVDTYQLWFDADGTLRLESKLVSTRGKMFTHLHRFKRVSTDTTGAKDLKLTLAEAIGQQVISAWIEPVARDKGSRSKVRTSSLLIARKYDNPGQLSVQFKPGLYSLPGKHDGRETLIWLAPAGKRELAFQPKPSDNSPPSTRPIPVRIQVLSGKISSKPTQLTMNTAKPPVLTTPEISDQQRINVLKFLQDRGHELPSGNAQELLDPTFHTAIETESSSSPLRDAYREWLKQQ
jgi:hypothetical protein